MQDIQRDHTTAHRTHFPSLQQIMSPFPAAATTPQASSVGQQGGRHNRVGVADHNAKSVACVV